MNKELDLSQEQVDYLLSPPAIRERALAIFDLCKEGGTHFDFHPEKMSSTTECVLAVIRKNYPDLKIPFHSRWGHFKVGGIDRVKSLDAKLAAFDPMERARTKLDLVITSVLLDAGAGAGWQFFEKSSGQNFSRSEGLGVASLYLFLSGKLSRDRKSLRADGLDLLTLPELEEAFQVSKENPLAGSEGRLRLLNNLAQALQNKKIFKDGRPGNILDYLSEKYGRTIPAKGLLRAILDGLGPIWPGRLSARGVNLGDVWMYGETPIPFHKLSQWMTYSLIEPIIEAGFTVEGVEELTGLAEYRNGGLLIDSGLFSLRDSRDLEKTWRPDSELIIEWRALTICMLDQFGAAIQTALGFSAKEFPLAKVLEGGTWWAGRFLAKEKRPNGDPPIMIQSDGTVF